MKRIFKRNQIVLTLLAVMIAVAGYLSYAGKEETEAPVGMQDISEEDILAENQAASMNGDKQDIVSLDNDPNDEVQQETEGDVSKQQTGTNIPGEAILTSGISVGNYLAEVRLTREQIRAKSKANYLEIINHESLTEEAKTAAVASMLELTSIAEKENSAETLLTAKGFENSIVTIVDEQADVVIARSQITDAEKAQIEDIVKRKCEMDASQIVITLMELAP